MPLITEIVDAMRSAQEAGLKVLAYVIPISPEALERSGLAAATIEDRVQTVMIRELKACLGGDTTIGKEGDLPDGRPVWLTDRDLEDIIYCLKKQLSPHLSAANLPSSARSRANLMNRLLDVMAPKTEEVL